MFIPGQALGRDIIELFIAALNNNEIKAELSKYIRIEMDSERNKYNGSVQSYDSLTSGNVNMQAKMAASGYDIYGRTILNGNKTATNNSIYRKMKNKIKYKASPQDGYQNRGKYNQF